MRSRFVRLGVMLLAVVVSSPVPANGTAAASPSAARVRYAGIRADAALALDPSVRLGYLPTGSATKTARQKMLASIGGGSDPADAGTVAPRFPGSELGFDSVANLSPFASPADATGAAGPNFFLAAVNVHAAVYDRSGAQVLAPRRLRQIAGLGAGYGDTDPKVVYDPSRGGWFVLSFIAYTNSVVKIVVVTVPEAQADDPGAWCATVLNGDQVAGNGAQFSDYDTLGFDGDRVSIATNNFNFSGTKFEYTQIISMKKSQLYDLTCSDPLSLAVFGGNRTKNPDGSKGATLQPVVPTDPAAAGTTQHFTSFEKSGTKGKVILWQLKKTSKGLKLSNVAKGVGAVKIAPWGRQGGGGSRSNQDTWWDTGDLRLVNATYDTTLGRIYTAHAVSHEFGASPAESAVRWYEVDPSAPLVNSTVTRKGYVGTDGSDAAWPSAATDSDGVLYLNFSQASLANSEFLSVHIADVQTGVTTFSDVQMKAGIATYNAFSGIERWGDYSAIMRDPLDGTRVVAFNSYAVSRFLWQGRTHVVFQD